MTTTKTRVKAIMIAIMMALTVFGYMTIPQQNEVNAATKKPGKPGTIKMDKLKKSKGIQHAKIKWKKAKNATSYKYTLIMYGKNQKGKVIEGRLCNNVVTKKCSFEFSYNTKLCTKIYVEVRGYNKAGKGEKRTKTWKQKDL